MVLISVPCVLFLVVTTKDCLYTPAKWLEHFHVPCNDCLVDDNNKPIMVLGREGGVPPAFAFPPWTPHTYLP